MVLKASVSPRSSSLAQLRQGLGSRASLCFRALPRHFFCSLVLVLASLFAIPARAQNTNLQTAAGGVTITGGNPNGAMNMGNVNGLGIAPNAGETVVSAGVSGGV